MKTRKAFFVSAGQCHDGGNGLPQGGGTSDGEVAENKVFLVKSLCCQYRRIFTQLLGVYTRIFEILENLF